MEVYWLEQQDTDVPVANNWLSPAELSMLERLHIPKRRADWRLGRWTAKCALARYLGIPDDPKNLIHIEIRPTPSGAPEAVIKQEFSTAAISISHRAGIAMCSVGWPGSALGCDLDLVESHGDLFVADYFTSQEQQLIVRAHAADQDLLVCLIWSAKESVLKAVRAGLRVDTRDVAVNIPDMPMHIVSDGGNDSCVKETWLPLHARYGRAVMNGWWQTTGEIVRTIIAAPCPAVPIQLSLAPMSNVA